MAMEKRLAAEWRLTVDPEFKNLLDDHSPEEKALFEESLRRDGCRDAIVVWAGTGIVVDGHHRLDFCQANDIEFAVEEIEFDDRSAAKEWIILNQLARRNLPQFRRAELALAYKPIIEARAKENQRSAGGAVPQKSAEAVETRKELAKIAGTSHDTIAKVEKIKKDAPETIRQLSRSNEISVNAAYQATKLPEEAQKKIEEGLERGEKKPKEVVRDVINEYKKEDRMEAATIPVEENIGYAETMRPDMKHLFEVGPSTYNIDDLVEEVNENGEDYLRGLRTLIEVRFPQFDNVPNRMKVRKAIQQIIDGFKQLKEDIR